MTADDSNEPKDVTGLVRVKAEMLFGEKREERRHDGEAGDGEEESGDDRPKQSGVTVLKHFRETVRLCGFDRYSAERLSGRMK